MYSTTTTSDDWTLAWSILAQTDEERDEETRRQLEEHRRQPDDRTCRHGIPMSLPCPFCADEADAEDNCRDLWLEEMMAGKPVCRECGAPLMFPSERQVHECTACLRAAVLWGEG